MKKRDRAYDLIRKVLVDARSDAGLTQRQLADKLGRSHTFIAKIELGERRVDIVEFIELARALDMDPEELFSRVAQ